MLLRRLSVFAGWSLEMAEQVCADERPARRRDPRPAGRPGREVAGRGGARHARPDPVPDAGDDPRVRRRPAGRRPARPTRCGGGCATTRSTSPSTSMSIGMALIPAAWSARVDVFRRYDADAGNVREVLALVPGRRATPRRGLRICTAIRPCWIVRGAFAEGAEWLDAFLAGDLSGVPAGGARRGPDRPGAARAGAATRPGAGPWATRGPGAVPGGRGPVLDRHRAEPAGRGGPARRPDRTRPRTGPTRRWPAPAQAGDKWNEGYALGTRAAAAGRARQPARGAGARRGGAGRDAEIDQQWGAARTLLGLGDLARLRGDLAAARHHYLAALAHPARGRRPARRSPAAWPAWAGSRWTPGDLRPAREHLAASLRLSLAAGSRTGISRGLLAFATLAVARGPARPRGPAQPPPWPPLREPPRTLPPLPGCAGPSATWTPRLGLGEPEVARLWAAGLELTSTDAAELALGAPPEPAPAGGRPASRLSQAAGSAAVTGRRATAPGAAGLALVRPPCAGPR